MHLKIIYWPKDKAVHKDIDDAIERALEPLGFERWASGYNLTEDCRDISFDRTNEGN